MTPIADRLSAVRREMLERQLDALIIPRADEYLGEYIPARNERLRWISGFTGSAGVVVVLADQAAIFVDGRYTVQVRKQVPDGLFEILHLVEQPHLSWLARRLSAGNRVGYDPRLHPYDWQREADSTLGEAGLNLVELDDNPVDRCWAGRPAAEISEATLLPESLTGRSSRSKRLEIGAKVTEKGADAALIFAPDSVAWLLNIRGRDVPCVPVVLGFALLRADGTLQFFTDPAKIPEDFDSHVGEGVEVLPETVAATALQALTGQKVLADPATANAWCQLTMKRAGAELIAADDPVMTPKACKNATEIEGMRRAHRRDGAAVVRFLAWLDGEVEAGRLHSEAELSDRLYQFRASDDRFRGPSFDTISAASANAAMCHYNHQNFEESSRLQTDSVYLVDSGGQYPDGTTDITRTIAIGNPGEEIRRRFTLVLKGHIALDRVVFPSGTNGTQLDVLARQFLWREGLDYDHGTGHGVGAYLSVHEGPQRIAKPFNGHALQPGMVVSNEPGFYKDGAYGIRCENLVVVREAEAEQDDGPPMFRFEALTLAPFDRRLIETGLLTHEEIEWIDSYHARVREAISPLLGVEDRAWLEHATAALEPETAAGGTRR
jgi:Xaa-Pro aminopeptidase